MQWLRFAILILVSAILQAGFIMSLNIRPDLLLIALVFFAIYSNITNAIIASFAIGFASDLIGGSAMGPHMISFGFFGTLLAYLNRVIAVRRKAFQGSVIFITGFLAIGLAAVLANIVKNEPLSPRLHKDLFGMSLCSAVIGPFLFLPIAWLMGIKIDGFSRRKRN